MGRGVLGRLLTGVALVGKSDGDLLVGDCLDLNRQFGHLGAVLGIGRGGVQRQQVPQRVHRHVRLGPLPLLVPVVASTMATRGGGLQRAATGKIAVKLDSRVT